MTSVNGLDNVEGLALKTSGIVVSQRARSVTPPMNRSFGRRLNRLVWEASQNSTISHVCQLLEVLIICATILRQHY